MSILRTPEITLDEDFHADGEITKSYVDDKTGQRHIVGVASGVKADQDGERCSRRAVAKMAATVQGGGVKLTSSHDQDWLSEIGDVVKAEHDTETDQLVVDTVLPPEGEDPVADKAWKTVNTQKVGFSIGGKLLGAYFERNELGKKRKVLDNIALRHIMLTKKPSYADSFATAVAKTFTGQAPADDEFTLELDEDADVAKDTSSGSWVGGNSDSGGGNVGRDSVGSGPRNAGTKSKDTGMKTEDSSDDDSDTDADDGKDLPDGTDQARHLACPNCGHEFAADLPVDPNERMVDDTTNDDEDAGEDTGKSLGSPLMSKLTETLDSLRGLATADVEKTAPEPEAAAAEETTAVEKTATTSDDIAKMVAAGYADHEAKFEDLSKSVGEGFELIAKAVKGLQEQLAELPQGRKSVARVLPAPTGHETEQVEKTTEEIVAEAPDAVSALKALNQAAGWTR